MQNRLFTTLAIVLFALSAHDTTASEKGFFAQLFTTRKTENDFRIRFKNININASQMANIVLLGIALKLLGFTSKKIYSFKGVGKLCKNIYKYPSSFTNLSFFLMLGAYRTFNADKISPITFAANEAATESLYNEAINSNAVVNDEVATEIVNNEEKTA